MTENKNEIVYKVVFKNQLIKNMFGVIVSQTETNLKLKSSFSTNDFLISSIKYLVPTNRVFEDKKDFIKRVDKPYNNYNKGGL